MKRLFVLLFLVSYAFAGKGSIYSRYGIGDINPFLSGKNVGMGNTGVAMFGETHISLLNPASSANITTTILSASYQYSNFNSQDASGSSIFGTGNISSFALAFPVYAPKKIVVTLGILPFSSVGYEQSFSDTTRSGNKFVQSFDGRGGVSSGQISASYSVDPDFIVGLTAHYLFGSIYRDQSITFLTGTYFGGSFNQTYSLSGVALTLGGIYSGVDKALGLSDTKQLNIGATLFSGSSLNYHVQTLRNFPINQDTVSPADKSMDLPFGFSYGLAYLKNRTVYAADLHFQNWGNFKVGGVHPAEIQNSIRYSGGVEFLPSSDFVSDDLMKRLSYRFGGYYRVTNLNMNGQSINEMFVSAGISLPMSIETRLHLGLEYGIRGTTSSALIKDSMLRFTLSVSASEMMFIQPPIE